MRRSSPPPLLGALVGFALFSLDGIWSYAPWLGAGLGYLLADRLALRAQLDQLADLVERLADGPPERRPPEAVAGQKKGPIPITEEGEVLPPPMPAPSPELREPLRPARDRPLTPAERARRAMRRERTPLRPRPEAPQSRAASSPPVSWQDSVPEPVLHAWSWLRGGNWVARIGIVVLFVGLALLVGLAIEAGLIPIELRLMAAALAGGALVGAGWYWRERGGFGVTLQGGGVGVLYLVVYAALQLYGLLPAPLAFGLMAVVAVLAAALAVLQDQPALAVLGTLGGFGAPIAASTGEGSAVLLFGYYAMLNVGIAAVALRRTWRGLILLGFVCTFVVGATWGGLAYRPGLYAEVQPFLAFFFVLYLALTVLIARGATARPGGVRTRPYGRVEGSLVFGLPVAAFALQAALVSPIPNGRAWSAAVLAAAYLLVSVGLRRAKGERFGPLSEAFLAVGVVFATATVPLATSTVWVGSLWALEAAGLAWFGVRYGRRWMRTGALALAVASGLALAWSIVEGAGWRIGRFGLGGWTVAAGLLVAAGVTRLEPLRGWEEAVRRAAFYLGVTWWVAAGVLLADDLASVAASATASPLSHSLALVVFSGSALLAGFVGRRLAWRELASAAFVLVPLAAAVLAVQTDGLSHPFAAFGWLAWPAAIATILVLIASTRAIAHPVALSVGHIGWAALSVAVVVYQGWEWTYALGLGSGWTAAVLGAACSVALALVLSPTAPLARLHERYVAPGEDGYRVLGWGLAVVLAFWLLIDGLETDGDAAPLPFIPLLNPLDLCVIGALVVLARAAARLDAARQRLGAWAVGVLGVLSIAGAVARAVHHLGGVAYRFEPMWSSGPFQTALAIAWAAVAFVLMATASRSGRRGRWFGGAALLGLVVLKLFTVDLEAASAVARVVSFIAVGLLALGIGYASPLPPPDAPEPAAAPEGGPQKEGPDVVPGPSPIE